MFRRLVLFGLLSVLTGPQASAIEFDVLTVKKSTLKYQKNVDFEYLFNNWTSRVSLFFEEDEIFEDSFAVHGFAHYKKTAYPLKFTDKSRFSPNTPLQLKTHNDSLWLYLLNSKDGETEILNASLQSALLQKTLNKLRAARAAENATYFTRFLEQKYSKMYDAVLNQQLSGLFAFLPNLSTIIGVDQESDQENVKIWYICIDPLPQLNPLRRFVPQEDL